MTARSPAPRVLVVDDDDEVCALVCHILRDQGYVVDAVGDGDAALARASSEVPDLVLLDLILPGADGWTVLERLRGLPDPPLVVGLTALDSYETFKGFVREGVDGYLGKPFRFQDLVDICRRLLASRGREPASPVALERRKLPRRQLMVAVKVMSRENLPVALGEIVDLSPAGAHVHVASALEPGAHVRLAFQVAGVLPGGYEALVRWRVETGTGYAHGLEFVHLTPEDTRQLEELLEPRP